MNGVKNVFVTMPDGRSEYREVYKDAYGNTIDKKTGQQVHPVNPKPSTGPNHG